MNTNSCKHTVTLCVGANFCGQSNVSYALDCLESSLEDIVCSGIYTTPAEGNSIGEYTNAVVSGTTEMDYDSLVVLTKALELEFGRDDICRSKGLVPLDVDIVVWDGEVKRPRDYRSSYFRIGISRLLDSKSLSHGF